MSRELFGTVLGGAVILLISCYAVYLAAMTLRGFSEFIQVTSLTRTPQIPIMILILSAALYLSRGGIGIMGKWSLVVFAISAVIIIFSVLTSINVMDVKNIMPVMSRSPREISDGAFSALAFPFGEVILILAFAGSFKKDNPYKIFFWGVTIGGFLLLIISLRDILVLGETVNSVYYPDYAATRIVKMGSFLQGTEAVVSLTYIFMGITKTAVCLLAASKGLSAAFKIGNYRNIILPVGLLTLTLCAVLYKNIIEMFEFMSVYPVYAALFQIFIPLLIWTAAEIRIKKFRTV